jgi:hypothetical protein
MKMDNIRPSENIRISQGEGRGIKPISQPGYSVKRATGMLDYFFRQPHFIFGCFAYQKNIFIRNRLGVYQYSRVNSPAHDPTMQRPHRISSASASGKSIDMQNIQKPASLKTVTKLSALRHILSRWDR